MASQTAGIQQLLSAERKAAEAVGEARKRKNRRLKQAKDEAQVEVEAYRAEREAEFAAYETTHLGNKAEIAARIEADTVNQLAEMTKGVATNKDHVLDQLMDTISAIKPEVHVNLRD